MFLVDEGENGDDVKVEGVVVVIVDDNDGEGVK